MTPGTTSNFWQSCLPVCVSTTTKCVPPPVRLSQTGSSTTKQCDPGKHMGEHLSGPRQHCNQSSQEHNQGGQHQPAPVGRPSCKDNQSNQPARALSAGAPQPSLRVIPDLTEKGRGRLQGTQGVFDSDPCTTPSFLLWLELMCCQGQRALSGRACPLPRVSPHPHTHTHTNMVLVQCRLNFPLGLLFSH